MRSLVELDRAVSVGLPRCCAYSCSSASSRATVVARSSMPRWMTKSWYWRDVRGSSLKDTIGLWRFALWRLPNPHRAMRLSKASCYSCTAGAVERGPNQHWATNWIRILFYLRSSANQECGSAPGGVAEFRDQLRGALLPPRPNPAKHEQRRERFHERFRLYAVRLLSFRRLVYSRILGL